MLKELIKAIYEIAKAIKGDDGENNGNKSITPFAINDAPVGVIQQGDSLENLIPIDEFVSELFGSSESIEIVRYDFVYDKTPDVNNFVSISSDKTVEIGNNRYSAEEIVEGKYILRMMD